MSRQFRLGGISAIYKAATLTDGADVKQAALDAMAAAVSSDVMVLSRIDLTDTGICESSSRGLKFNDLALSKFLRSHLLNRRLVDKSLSNNAVQFEAESWGRSPLARVIPRKQTIALELFSASPSSGFGDYLLLLREERKPYSLSEVRVLKELLFHFREADAMSVAQALIGRAVASEQIGHAMLTSTAKILRSCPRFDKFVQKEFPDWKGGSVPFRITGAGQIQGRRGPLLVRSETVGNRILLGVWERSEVDNLSPREMACAKRVCVGLSLKEIGYEMGIATSTAATLLKRSMEKLNTHDRRTLRLRLQSHPSLQHAR